jgi:hypothetical protein
VQKDFLYTPEGAGERLFANKEITAAFAAERGIYEVRNCRKKYGSHRIPQGRCDTETGQTGQILFT